MNAELHEIERSCTPAPGGLRQILLVQPGDVTVPAYYLLPNIEGITFDPGAAAFLLQHDRVEGRLQDTTPTNNVAGDYWEYTLNFAIRHIRIEVDWLRAKLRNRRVHVLATYNDGQQRFVPYMRITGKSDSAERPNGRNATSFLGVAQLLKPAPLMDSVVVGTGGGSGTVPPTEPSGGGVEPVVITTSAATYTYTVPAGMWLIGVRVLSTDAQTVSLGTSPGGDELGGPIAMDALQYGLLGSDTLCPDTNTPIYFSGLAGTNTIQIWLLG